MADRMAGRHRADNMPSRIADGCRSVARSLRHKNADLRYDKIESARDRIASGYYSSPDVVHTIASRLLEEIWLA
jgi:uncharacterized protein with HEPN domain